MLGQKHLDVNAQGHLTVSGADTLDLAAKYGTPLYLVSEDGVREVCREYVRAMQDCYGGHGRVLYASKAFCCKEMCRVVASEGFGLDVVSGGEIYTAVSAGVDPALLYFHGNNKTAAELAYAVQAGVGTVVVDNLPELRRLDSIAGAAGRVVKILLRVKPGIEAHTHQYIRTGQIDSKFGFALETGEAMEAVLAAEAAENLHLDGIHCHIGSQIFETQPFEEAPAVMMGFLAQIRDRIGRELAVLNLGGGFGIKYLEENDPRPYSEYMAAVAKAMKAVCEKLGMALPFICIEPGRSVIGASGVTLYTVGSVKEIPGVRTYVGIDGGMTDNPRYALYKSEYTALIADRADAPKDAVVTIAGRCCESGDLIGENMPIQAAQEGDTLAVLSTGAYNYSMASNYNRVPRPPVVFIRNGEDRLAVKRETYEDVAGLDI